MGSGAWSASTYARVTAPKVAAGTSFGYTASAKKSGRYEVHADLDPSKKNAAGLNIRESRDNNEHPNSVPIFIGFDETGSMGSVPRVVQQKLALLFGLLLRKGYVSDPQVAIAAYGDAEADRAPIQVAQFESDNRIDDALDRVFIEGNGGGNSGESQSLLWYYLAYHTETDAFEKRGKKGYAFFIGDERVLPTLHPDQIKRFVGDDQPLGALDNRSLVKALKEKWEPYILLIDNSAAKWQGSEKFYKDLFGEKSVLIVEDPASIAETIALAIGVNEGTVDFDDAVDDLVGTGANALAVRSASKAVAGLAATLGATGAVAKTSGSLNRSGGSRSARI